LQQSFRRLENIETKKILRGETKMDDLEKLLNKQLENEEFKKEWEEFQPELQLMKKVIGEKIKQNISQKELADKRETK
jgi:negative regulator of sigma E activity